MLQTLDQELRNLPMAQHQCGQRKHSNKRLLPILKQIYATEVTLEKSENKKILEAFLENFRKKTSNFDGLFHFLFEYFYPTGSSYEGLRVKVATEFDINVVFSLPFPLKVEEMGDIPFVKAQLTQSLPSLLQSYPYFRNLHINDIFDEEGYLIGRKVLSWFQCLVDHFINTEHSSMPSQVQKVQNSSSGPAHTLNLDVGGQWFSVDLVPVFKLDDKTFVKNLAQFPGIIQSERLSECHIIPKPIKKPETLLLSDADTQLLWRVHFPTAEKHILRGKNALKPVIKLLKCLKEKENWPIPSYFIKTVGILLAKQNPDPKYWEEAKMDLCFLQALEYLLNATLRRKLSHVFYPGFNLFHATQIRGLTDTANRIGKILKHLRHDPKSAKKVFRCQRHFVRNGFETSLCVSNYMRRHF